MYPILMSGKCLEYLSGARIPHDHSSVLKSVVAMRLPSGDQAAPKSDPPDQ